MLKVGITGGIGSGKSAVCKIIEKFGNPILYADDIAKELLFTNDAVKKRIRYEFDEDIYDEKGSIDKKKLAKLIFFDSKLKTKLENIVHPFVIDYVKKQFKKFESSNEYKIIFLEAALIYESGVDELLDYVVVVNADQERCINRVIERDKTSRDDVLGRINAQMDPKQKVEMADFVIHNNGDINSLNTNVEFIYKLLLKISETQNGLKST
ncbi:MAG: dephospho-CoA kinase [Bacteroidota bacterium]|nr:dephospho-CoA kinase [Bacteroidota bacterium]